MSDAYLRNAVLDNANLSDQDLSGMDLTGVSLKGATLSRVNLSGATLYAAKFDGCDLTLTTFDAQPKFSRNPAFRTSFRNAKVNFSTLGKDWRYFDLSGADILGMPEDLGGLQADYVLLQKSLALKGAKLSGSSFKYADLSGAGLDGADLSEATQAGSDQTVKTDFSNANLSGAVFTQANLRGAVLFQALLRNAHFERCNLMEANLRGVFADKTDTEGAAIFLRSYMVNAVLDHGQFTEADFSEVHLYGDHASVNGASLGGAGFSKAILSSLGLARATLEAADFTGAQLINSDFTGATLKDIRFERAYLQGAKFAHTTVTRCSFAGALFGTAAGYQRVTESDSETYTVAWPAFAPSSVKFDGTCTCPDGFAGPCALAAQFTPDDRSAPFPPIPDQIPDSAHAVAPPPDFGIPGLK